MATIAELAQAPVGTPIVGLQAYVSGAYETKPFGKGHMQTVTITDGTGQMLLRVMDGPEIVAGMNIQVSALPKEVTVRGQKQTELDGAYTEVYNDKMRFNCKSRCLMILAGGPAAPAPPPQPAYQAAGVATAPGGYGYPQPAQGLAPGGPYAAQTAPPYAQAAPPPAGPAYGQPATLPPVGSAQRPDPAWMAGQPTLAAAAAPIQGGQQAAKAPWQPPAKMGEAECKALLERNYFGFCQNLCRDYGVDEVKELPPEVVAGAMAWSTSLLIAIQRGDIIREPETEAEPPEPWPAAGQAMSPAGDGGPAFDAGPEELDF